MGSHGRRTCTGALLAFMGVAASLVPSQAIASQPNPVLAPDDGESVAAGSPALIKVRVGRSADRFRAQLNGRSVARHFSAPSRSGVRTLRASPGHGLRHGPSNSLRVVVRRGDERVRESVTFRVRGNRPLAAAGLDRRAPNDGVIHLSGRRSQRHPRADGDLDYGWRIVRAPRASGLRTRGLAGDDEAAKLAHAGTASPELHPDASGTYRIRLSVSAGDGTTASDAAEIRVDPVPAVPVNTISNPGNPPVVDPTGPWGVQVGEDYYPIESGAWAQLVALDRATLDPVVGDIQELRNKSYFCPGEAPDPCVAEIRADLRRLSKDEIVIVASQPSDDERSNPPPYGLEGALGSIGVSRTAFSQSLNLRPGNFSAIGVPGTAPGEGAWHAVPTDEEEGDGFMHDWLVRNNEGEYSFAASDRIEFNTQAAGSTDFATGDHFMEVGERRFRSLHGFHEDGTAAAGLVVEVLDDRTLEPVSQGGHDALPPGHYYTTNNPVAGIQELTALRDTLRSANSSGGKIVLISSRGVPAVVPEAAKNDLLRDIADEIEKLGGTRGAIFRTLDPGLQQAHSYTLVGHSNLGAGRGEEALGSGTRANHQGGAGFNTAPIVGTLVRSGPNYSFEVERAQVGGMVNGVPSDAASPSKGAAELLRVAFQQPTPWPEDTPERKAALAWIGGETVELGQPRAQYWTKAFVNNGFDYDYFKGLSKRIQALEFPADRNFGRDDFEWAQRELRNELAWLDSTHRYIEALAQPFATDQLTSWAAVADIANGVRGKVGVGRDAKTNSQTRAYFEGLTGVLSAFSEPAHAAEAVYEAAMELAEAGNEPASDGFQEEADRIGEEMAERLKSGQQTLVRQLANTIASDYGKLSTIGLCTSPIPSQRVTCPIDPANFQYTQDDQAAASRALKPAMEAWAYSALLPARYQLFRLPQWWETKTSANFYGLTAFAQFFPWDGLPESAQVAKPIYRNMPNYEHSVDGSSSSGDTWQIYALGFLTGSGTITDHWVMNHPVTEGGSAITDRLFKPTAQGGLGVDPEGFFARYFTPRTLDNYPEADTPTGWCAGGIRASPNCGQ